MPLEESWVPHAAHILERYTGEMLVWVNGQISPPADAKISIFDRGFLYGDAVYELIRFFRGHGVEMVRHRIRLERSLREIGITGFDPHDMDEICVKMLEELGVGDATIYLQVTRGVQIPRSHAPADGLKPNVVAIASKASSLAESSGPSQIRAVVLPDERRVRCDVKATNLLENVLGTMHANQVGADEPIYVHEGMVTETASANLFIVEDGRLITPPLGGPRSILPGVMRAQTLEIADDLNLAFSEEQVTEDRLRAASEAFVTSSRRLASSITEIDGHSVNSGAPGPVTLAIHEKMIARIEDAIAKISNP